MCIRDRYYSISGTVKSTDPGYDPSIGEYNTFHDGDGGINKYFLGTGVKIGKYFSLGANLSFLSGSLERANQFVFSDFDHAFHNKSSESLEIKGFGADYGLQSVSYTHLRAHETV